MFRFLTLAVLLCACAHQSDAGRRVIIAGEKFGIQATRLLDEYDARKQDQIVAEATDKESALRSLIDYRTKRDRALRVLAAYRALLAAGEPLCSLYDAGARGDSDLATWFADVGQIGERLREALAAMGITEAP